MKSPCAFLLLLVAMVVYSRAEVLELTPEDFGGKTVGKDKGAFVEFYAPWCGHCKALDETWTALSNEFAAHGVLVAKVDGEKYSELGTKYGVSGFPTLKWFAAGSDQPEDYTGGRSLEELAAFVNSKAGTNVRILPQASPITQLTDDNFDSIVLDKTKSVMVEFYAPWCGHCKRLAPDYKKVAEAFAGQDNVIIAQLDAEKNRKKAHLYGVTGYPTLLWFSDTDKQPHKYTEGRSPAEFLDFINGETGADRTLSGGVTNKAGRIAALDTLARKFVVAGASARAQVIKQASAAVESNKKHKYGAVAKFYVVAMKRLLEDSRYPDKEIARINNLIKAGNVSPKQRYLFHLRKNIVLQFTS